MDDSGHLHVAPEMDQLRMLVNGLPQSEYYVDLPVAESALETESQFNVLDLASGWKIDFIIRKSRPFSLEEFARREVVDLEGVRVAIAHSPAIARAR